MHRPCLGGVKLLSRVMQTLNFSWEFVIVMEKA